jgi:hypothetical protein
MRATGERPSFQAGRALGLGNHKEIMVFRYTLRDLLWLVLVVAIACSWSVESARAKQWRQRAEIAAGQLEAEKMGKMIFEPEQVVFLSPQKDAAFQQTVYPTDRSR